MRPDTLPPSDGPPIWGKIIGGILALAVIVALVPLIVGGCGMIILVFLVAIISRSSQG